MCGHAGVFSLDRRVDHEAYVPGAPWLRRGEVDGKTLAFYLQLQHLPPPHTLHPGVADERGENGLTWQLWTLLALQLWARRLAS
jgi:hypothetical protein